MQTIEKSIEQILMSNKSVKISSNKQNTYTIEAMPNGTGLGHSITYAVIDMSLQEALDVLNSKC